MGGGIQQLTHAGRGSPRPEQPLDRGSALSRLGAELELRRSVFSIVYTCLFVILYLTMCKCSNYSTIALIGEGNGTPLQPPQDPSPLRGTLGSSLRSPAEFQKNIYFCFIDYAKAFDCVNHNKLWKSLIGGLLGVAGRLSGTVLRFRAEAPRAPATALQHQQ